MCIQLLHEEVNPPPRRAQVYIIPPTIEQQHLTTPAPLPEKSSHQVGDYDYLFVRPDAKMDGSKPSESTKTRYLHMYLAPRMCVAIVLNFFLAFSCIYSVTLSPKALTDQPFFGSLCATR